MDFLSLIKLYPKVSGLLVGFAIGAVTYTVSSEFCAGTTECNSPYRNALLLGSALVGLYCVVYAFAPRKLASIGSLAVGGVVTLLTYLAQVRHGIRGVFDPKNASDPSDGTSLLYYVISFGVLTLIYAGALEVLTKERTRKKGSG